MLLLGMRENKRIEFGTIERTDSSESFPLKVKITLAKTGVLEYIRSDGTVTKEAKLPEDLFHKNTIESLKGAPITMEHPEGLVSKCNSKELVKGAIMDSIAAQNGALIGNGVIYDADLINRIKTGEKKEVSIGFTHRLEKKDGEINGKEYNYVQRDIIVNHVAATDSGRAGSEVAIHLDSNKDVAVQKTDIIQKEIEKMADSKKVIFTLDEDIMGKIAELKGILDKKDSKHIETAAEKIGEVVAELQAAVKEAPPVDSLTDLAASKQRIANLEAQVTALQTVIDTIKVEMEAATSPEAMDKRLESRSTIIEIGKSTLKDFKSDGKTNQELMVEIANEILPTKDDEEKLTVDSKDEIVKARYDAAVELSRVKSIMGGHQGNKKVIKNDESYLTELKENRLNLKGVFGRRKDQGGN